MNNFTRAMKILYLDRNYAIAMLLLLLVFSAAGFIFPNLFTDEKTKLANEIVSMTAGKNFTELAWTIIINNLRTGMIAIILGLIFGIVPLLSVALNGYFLGSVMSAAWKVNGALTLLYVIPHGIFELPALAISFGMGLKMGLWFMEKKKIGFIKQNLSNSMLVYFYIILPMVVLAGIIESGLISLVK